MARVTVDEVKEIIETTRTNDQITPVITAANLVVTAKVGSSTLVSTDLAKELERWLTAHFLSATVERQEMSAKVGDLSVTYARLSKVDLLSTTTYGQQVLIMDPTGAFAASGNKQAKLRAITSFD